MENNNDLDSFLTDSTQGAPNIGGGATQNLQTEQRPRLRKIKRAKVRAASPIMPIVEKTESNIPENMVSNDMPSSPSSTDASLPSPQSIAEQDTSLSESSFSSNQETFETESKPSNAQGTDLITSSDAQEITSENFSDLHISDDLSPELNYENDEDYETFYEGDTGYIKKSIFYVVSCTCLFLGLFIGKTLFSSQKIENHGLEGVVTNPDVPAGRPRCGLTDKSQACIFYIMNWYKQELNGRDFYKMAAQLTGREEYMIETDNLRYATVKIRPGHFAQLNIPALKE